MYAAPLYEEDAATRETTTAYSEAVEGLEVAEDLSRTTNDGLDEWLSREASIIDDMDEEDAIEVDPPPRALVSAQMEFLIASAAVGERASEFSDASDLVEGGAVRAWRVDAVDLKLRPVALDDIGEASEACFVVLDGRGRDEVDIYHWIGVAAPKSAIAVAAFKSVELTKICRDVAAVRSACRREVQGDESEEFLALVGNFESAREESKEDDDARQQRWRHHHGVRKAPSSTPTRLLAVVIASERRRRLSRGARLADVEPSAAAFTLLAARDVFILDSGVDRLFLWYGVASSQARRGAGLEAALVLRRERAETIGGCDPVVVCTQASEPPEFWATLGVGTSVRSAKARTADDDDTLELLGVNILSRRSTLQGSCAAFLVTRDVVAEEKALVDKALDALVLALQDELVNDGAEACAVLFFPSLATANDATLLAQRLRGAPDVPEAPWWRGVSPPTSPTTTSSPRRRDDHEDDSRPAGMLSWLRSLVGGGGGGVKRAPSWSGGVPERVKSHFSCVVSDMERRIGDDETSRRRRRPRLVVVAWRRSELVMVEDGRSELRLHDDGVRTLRTLRSSASAVLDTGGAIYVWRGTSSGGNCRAAARQLASELASRRPSWCGLYEVVEGSESLAFRSNFVDWTETEVAKTRRLAENSFNRDYGLRRTSSAYSPRPSLHRAPSATRTSLELNNNHHHHQEAPGDEPPAAPQLLAHQRDIFAAVAAMLRQSWSSAAAGTPHAESTSMRSSSLSRRHSSSSLSRRELRTRRRRREYLCGDADDGDESDDDDDALERRSREHRRASVDGGSLSINSGEHHVVAWRIDNGKLVRLDEEHEGNFESTMSYAILYGATVETVAAHDIRSKQREDSLEVEEDWEESLDVPSVLRHDSECYEDVLTPHGTAAEIALSRQSLRPANRPRPDARFILIFWEGERSRRDDRSRWLLDLRPWLLEDWAEELTSDVEHLRVRQRREPRLFLQIALRAMGGYVVHVAPSPQSTHLFHVRGDSLASAVEVAPQASSLCSADVFVAARRPPVAARASQLDVEDADWTVWVWVGSGSNRGCRKITAGLVLKVMDYFGIDDERTKVQVLDECGDDGSDRRRGFWRALGGPRPYADHPLLRVPAGQRSSVARAPLFFVVAERKASSADNLANEPSTTNDDATSSGLTCVLHTAVEQHRLLHETRAIVVDAHFAVLVWLGKRARRRDALLAKRLAFAYAAATRSPPCRVRVVTQGVECPHFKALFHGWDARAASTARRRANGATIVAQPFVDPRASYIARRMSTLRHLKSPAQTPDRQGSTSWSPGGTSRKRSSPAAQTSIFTALLGALAPPQPSVNNKHNHRTPHVHVVDREIQLGRVIDSPEARDSDSDDEDAFVYRPTGDVHGVAPCEALAHSAFDPVVQGAEEAREAARRRRKSCSF